VKQADEVPSHPAPRPCGSLPAISSHRSRKKMDENDEINPMGYLETEKSQDKYKDKDKDK
jgi:hypothetical protein